MNKFFILLIIILGVISCEQSTNSADYFGQTYPKDIPVIFAPDLVSIKGRFEHGISFAPNTQEFVFGILNKEDFSGDIYHSKKLNKNWTEPTIFEPLKEKCAYLPYFSPDGKSLLYAQSKTDTDNGVTDIWRLEKVNDNWGTPKKMQPPLSSISREANASMTEDETIYFSSNRNCIGKENCYAADLFYAKKVDGQYQNVEIIAELSSPNDEESLFIAPNEEYLIFCSYTNNESGMDLYISYRDYNDNWLKPQLLNSTINSKDWDRRPFVTKDQQFLFFTRLQIGEKGLTESDIYWVNTSKLFKPFIYHPIAEIVVPAGKKFEISLPVDYFKDIDDEQLVLSMNQTSLNWLTFDEDKKKLTGFPPQEGVFEVTFTAADKYLNRTEDKVEIVVGKL